MKSGRTGAPYSKNYNRVSGFRSFVLHPQYNKASPGGIIVLVTGSPAGETGCGYETRLSRQGTLHLVGVFMQLKKLGRFPFGKYAGKLIADIAITDPKYLHWLLEQTWLQKHLRALICKALDIDETLLPQISPAPSTPRPQYGRRILRDSISEQKTKE